MQKSKIIYDQEYFFDIDSKINKEIRKDIFYDYAIKEVLSGFSWLGSVNSILDYGCGVGITLDLYLKTTENFNANIYGVDISVGAIKKIEGKHKIDNYHFFRIQNNKIPQIDDDSIKGCYLIHVLHHSQEHEAIFNEIYKKLELHGKFFVCDLSANNFLINFGRKIFIKLPKFIKNRFSNDLVVDGNIPEKYDVDVLEVINKLKKAGFKIEDVGYGHLFSFIFEWLNKIFFISKIPFFTNVFELSVKIESFLFKYMFFQKRASLFYIKCLKYDKETQEVDS